MSFSNFFQKNDLVMNTLKTAANYRICDDLTNTDNVMSNTFRIGVQPALTTEMLEFAVSKIKSFLGVNS
jgi:CDP-4-dehydro-6-deoxyglucose reductase, E1